jgi:hypothetical protein
MMLLLRAAKTLEGPQTSGEEVADAPVIRWVWKRPLGVLLFSEGEWKLMRGALRRVFELSSQGPEPQRPWSPTPRG